MNKIKIIIKVLFSVIFFIVIADIFFKLKGHGYNSEFKESQFERYPFPYDMFRAKPNIMDHNKYGFRGPIVDDYSNKKILKIGFFGGSTGFYGDPPIPQLISEDLKKNGYKNIIFNFSSVSSSHSQHLHRLVEFMNSKFDIIVFYGGGNETLNYYYYDSRPGYPYNFFIRNELPLFKHFLLRYSSIVGKYDKITGGSFSGYDKMIDRKNKNYTKWSNEIAENYLNKLKMANEISTKSIKSEICKNPIFIPVTQPINLEFNLKREDFKLHYPKVKELVEKIYVKEKFQNLKNYLNYNYIANKLEFTDELHITQKSKIIVSNQLSNDLKKIIKNQCFN